MKISKEIQGVASESCGAVNVGFPAISIALRAVFLVAAVAILASCAGNKTPTMETSVVPAPTITATMIPTAITYHVKESEEPFTAQQKLLIESESALYQKARIQKWLDYWVQFDKRPFATNSDELNWKFIYDNPENPTEVMVMLEASGQYGGRLFTVPIGEGGFAEVPPVVEGDYIPEGSGPLPLSGGDSGFLRLSVENGVPVKRSLTDNQVIDKLNWKTGKWEMVAIDQAMFHNFPKSYEEILANPEAYVSAPDGVNPINTPIDFQKYFDSMIIPALGDPSTRIPNLNMEGSTYSAKDYYEVNCFRNGCVIEGNLGIFGFKWQGRLYPVVVINVGSNGVCTRTIAVALDNSEGNFGTTDSLRLIAEGEEIKSIRIMTAENEAYPDFINLTVRAGFAPELREVMFGAGTIRMRYIE